MPYVIPLKNDIVAGVTVLTLGSGGSSFLMLIPLTNAGLLSIIATFKCLVNGVLAKKIPRSKVAGYKFEYKRITVI